MRTPSGFVIGRWRAYGAEGRVLSPSSLQLDARILPRALEGDTKAIRALVDHLTPTIQARVARILCGRFHRTRDLDEAVADATQDVFAALFADGARTLRTWDATRGLSLTNFVGLVAERHLLSSLRGGSRIGAREQSATDEELARERSSESGPESTLTRRAIFDAVMARVESELTPESLRIFQLVFEEGRSIESICAELNMSSDSVYAWRSRLLKTVRRIAAELDADFSSEGSASLRTLEEQRRHG